MVRKFLPFRSERKKRSTSEGTPRFPNGISGKLPYHLTSNRNFRIFSPNGKHLRLCSSNDIIGIWRSFLGQPLVEKSTWSVIVPVLCDIYLLTLFVVTVAGKIETIMFPCTFCTKFLGHSFKRLLQHIKFIHSHEPNFSITRSDCGRSFASSLHGRLTFNVDCLR